MKPRVLIIPGYDNSGPAHWQTLWEKKHPEFIRVQQRDWLHPVCAEWVQTLNETIQKIPEPKLLVGHSIGCQTIAAWAMSHKSNIQGALLVAPPDVDSPVLAGLVEGFSPMPFKPLSFPSLLVASTNDPYTTIEKSQFLAKQWGSRLINIGPAGHINADSGFGPWPEGEKFLEVLR